MLFDRVFLLYLRFILNCRHLFQRRQVPFHAHIHEQRHDKGRGRQAAEGQDFRAEEFRRAAGGSNTFF